VTPNYSEHAAKKVTPRARKHRQYNGGAAAGGETAAVRGGEAAGLVQVSGGDVRAAWGSEPKDVVLLHPVGPD